MLAGRNQKNRPKLSHRLKSKMKTPVNKLDKCNLILHVIRQAMSYKVQATLTNMAQDYLKPLAQNVQLTTHLRRHQSALSLLIKVQE